MKHRGLHDPFYHCMPMAAIKGTAGAASGQRPGGRGSSRVPQHTYFNKYRHVALIILRGVPVGVKIVMFKKQFHPSEGGSQQLGWQQGIA